MTQMDVHLKQSSELKSVCLCAINKRAINEGQTTHSGLAGYKLKKKGPTGIRTRVARFKVWSANHYTMEPFMIEFSLRLYLTSITQEGAS